MAGGAGAGALLSAAMCDVLDHVIIAVRDLDAAEATYTRLLGRAASWAGGHPGLGSENRLFRLDNGYIELAAPVGEGAFADLLNAHLAERGEGIVGLAFRTADAEAAAQALRARGYAASDPIQGEGKDTGSGATRRWRNVMLPPESLRGLFVFLIEHLSPENALPLSEPVDGAAPGSAVWTLDHVVVNTGDADATAKFFADLGLRIAHTQTVEKWGVRQVFMRPQAKGSIGTTVEIVNPLNEARAGEPDFLWGIAYRVKDIAAAQARLAAAGADVSEVRTGRKKGTAVCTVRPETHGVATLIIGPA